MNLPDSVRRHFSLRLAGIDSQTAGKAEAIWRAGKVQWVREVDGGRLQAAVTGSHGESYRTTVDLAPRAGALQATSDCTCPVRFQCKHGAAALLTWMRDRGNGDVPADHLLGDDLPGDGLPHDLPAGASPGAARQRSRAGRGEAPQLGRLMQALHADFTTARSEPAALAV